MTWNGYLLLMFLETPNDRTKPMVQRQRYECHRAYQSWQLNDVYLLYPCSITNMIPPAAWRLQLINSEAVILSGREVMSHHLSLYRKTQTVLLETHRLTDMPLQQTSSASNDTQHLPRTVPWYTLFLNDNSYFTRTQCFMLHQLSLFLEKVC